MSVRSRISEYLSDVQSLCARIDPADVEAFVNVLFEAYLRDSTVYTCGNGGSASTAQHMAADLCKTTLVAGRRPMRCLSLNDNAPWLSALTNDDGWSRVYEAQLETWWRPGDVVVAISVHGGKGADRAGPWSRNLTRACDFAREHDGQALAMVGFDGGALRELCDASILVPIASTPHTEGMHVVLHHLVAAVLHERIRALTSE